MESIYWVISRDCNQKCPHCYNDSQPGAPGLNAEQVSQVITNLPKPDRCQVERIIISGGEVLVWPDLLFQALQELTAVTGGRTEMWVQTNGDLLDEATLQKLLEEPLIDMLDRCSQHPVYQALNEGRPEAMGESMGISESHGFQRSRELGNHCLWCDEFFVKHAPELLHQNGLTTRGDVDLVQLQSKGSN